MHDPLTVAFEIRRPWPKRARWNDSLPVGRWARIRGGSWKLAGRGYRFPSLVTVWHREPGGHDSGEVCKHYHRYQDAAGEWQYKFHHAWRLHAHHWRIQVPALQAWRRRLLTRCWCARCSRSRAFGMTEENLERARQLSAIPAGARKDQPHA